MEMYKESSSKVMVNRQFSKLFYITKGVLQGDTLAPFLIIVLDYSNLKFGIMSISYM